MHYGAPYGDEPHWDGLPKDPVALHHYFEEEVTETLELALVKRDYPTAYRLSRHTLKSDQREILSVIAEPLGPGAGYEVLSFELSDHSGIPGADPPVT